MGPDSEDDELMADVIHATAPRAAFDIENETG